MDKVYFADLCSREMWPLVNNTTQPQRQKVLAVLGVDPEFIEAIAESDKKWHSELCRREASVVLDALAASKSSQWSDCVGPSVDTTQQ